MSEHHKFVMFISSVVIATFCLNTEAIRVDWNTNTRPIVPASSTPEPVPVPPFQDPAPVWENNDDIPNPHPYKYVIPPTSRPRFNNPDDDKSIVNVQQINYSKIISNPNEIVDHSKTVPMLSVEYVPNVGYKYYAVVPHYKQQKINYLNTNDIYAKQDKFNQKLKKYKAYAKLKYPYYLYVPMPKQNIAYNNPSKAVSKS